MKWAAFDEGSAAVIATDAEFGEKVFIARCDSTRGKKFNHGHARRIVEAVNSFDSLREALEDAQEFIELNCSGMGAEVIKHKIRAALGGE